MATLSRSELVQELNQLFAEEVEAALRYLHLSHAVRGIHHLLVGPTLTKAFHETIEHAEVLAHQIRAHGAVPQLELSISLPPQSLDAKEALEMALTFEEAALEGYQETLRKVEGDVPLEEFIRAQIAAEDGHVAELRQLLME